MTIRKTSRAALALAGLLVLPLSAQNAAARDADISNAFAASDAQSQTIVDQSIWAGILQAYVKKVPDGINRFTYAKMSNADKAALKKYLAALQHVSPEKLNANEQHAYWINFYNALTVQVIVYHMPVKSIRDISSGLFTIGPWDLKLVTVEGHKLSLNNIEHDILRANWHDPRVHYTVNCASLGCPNLRATPYTGAHLDAELTQAARAFINHPRGVAVQNGKLTVSKIYQWYADDFGGTHAKIIAHLRKYAAPALAKQLSHMAHIDAYQYDWRLNAPGNKFTAP